METVQQEGTRRVNRKLEPHSLDAIIAVGYRMNSCQATQSRGFIAAYFALRRAMTIPPRPKNARVIGSGTTTTSPVLVIQPLSLPMLCT